eukprot:543986-Pyramimonas_sp.AAC.1
MGVCSECRVQATTRKGSSDPLSPTAHEAVWWHPDRGASSIWGSRPPVEEGNGPQTDPYTCNTPRPPLPLKAARTWSPV